MPRLSVISLSAPAVSMVIASLSTTQVPAIKKIGLTISDWQKTLDAQISGKKPAEAPPVAPVAVAAPKAICTKCGQQTHPNDRFCANCGEKLDPSSIQ